MRHATPVVLDALEPLLEQLRACDGITERKRGVFYRRSSAFLHFHEDPAGFFADVRIGPGWVRLPATTAADRRALLREVKAALRAYTIAAASTRRRLRCAQLPEAPEGDRGMGAAAALASSFTWALTSVLLASQTARVRPLLMSAIRSLTASLLLVGLLLVTAGVVQLREMTLITAVSMAGSGILGQAVGDTLYINALGFLGVSRTFPITNSAYPFLTLVLAVVLLGEEATWFVPLGGLLIVAGITWIVLEQRRADAVQLVPLELGRGLAFAVAAALAWASATVWLRGGQGNLDAVGAASLRIPAASLAVFATLALTSQTRQPLRELTGRSLAIVALAGLLGTGIGSVLFIYAVEHTGAARTAFVTTSAPVFALPMGVVFLSERFTTKLLLGTALTIVGIWLVLL